MLPATPAGRLELVQQLLAPPLVDEHGNVVGYGEPMISTGLAMELLDGPYVDPRHMLHGDGGRKT